MMELGLTVEQMAAAGALTTATGTAVKALIDAIRREVPALHGAWTLALAALFCFILTGARYTAMYGLPVIAESLAIILLDGVTALTIAVFVTENAKATRRRREGLP